MDYVFGLPTVKFVNYQFRKALPYWFKRWVLFQKNATLEPLYHFDSGSESEDYADDKAQTGFSETRETAPTELGTGHRNTAESVEAPTGTDITSEPAVSKKE